MSSWLGGHSNLLYKFLATAAVTICVSMAVLTYSVSYRLESSLLQEVAEDSAVLVDLFLGPHVQELVSNDNLSPAGIERLDAQVRTVLNERVRIIKIWRRDGTLVYATDKKLVGARFPSAHLERAFKGEVSGSFDDLDDAENKFDRQLDVPLIEIYAPFRRTGSSDIIAVGEVYSDGTRLAASLKHIRLATAGIVAAVTAPMLFVLFLIVRRANSIVLSHRASLSKKVVEAKALAEQNDLLRREADDARFETIQSNERLLGQIGQDLHDGPIQLLSIMSLKLGRLARRADVAESDVTAVQAVTKLNQSALTDLRDLSVGLVLPQLEGLNVRETIQLAIHRHEGLTGTEVAEEMADLDVCPSASLRICLFRIVQEGLNNAFHYAAGLGQHVSATIDGNQISIIVRDAGPDQRAAAAPSSPKTGLGLTGLQRRVRAFGGTLRIVPTSTGTEMHVLLPIDIAPEANGEMPNKTPNSRE
jgi:signal transduction histidine kinase